MHSYTESLLDNGLSVITSRHGDSWINFMELWVNAGSRYEGPTQLGYAHILEHMLLKGTRRHPNPYLLGIEKDRLGVYSNAQTNIEKISIVLRGLSRYKDKLVQILSEQALDSIIDDTALENEKRVTLEEYKKSIDDPAKYIAIMALKNFFSGHPLGKNVLGEPETIANATSQSLNKYYQSLFIPNGSALIFTGDIEHSDAVEIAQKYFGDWEKKTRVANYQNFPLKNKIFFEQRDTKQYHLVVSYNTVGIKSPKSVAALSFLSNYLNFGYTSPLMHELRTKEGLVYNINIFNGRFHDAGRLSIQTSTTEPEKVLQAIDIVIKSIPQKINDDLFNELLNQFIDSFQTSISDSENEINFLGSNFIIRGQMYTPDDAVNDYRSLTRDFFLQTVADYLTDERRHIGILGSQRVL